MNLVEIRCRHCRRVRAAWADESELPDDDVVRVDPCECASGRKRPRLVDLADSLGRRAKAVALVYHLVPVDVLRREIATARRKRRTTVHRL